MSSRYKHRATESQAGQFDLEYLYGLKEDVIDGCMEVNLIAKESVCPTCGVKMVLTERDRSGGYSWVCRKFGVNAHHVRRTVRKGRWFYENPFKPGLFGRRRHELDSPNLGGQLHYHSIPCYNLLLRRTEMGWLARMIGAPYRAYLRSDLRISPPLTRRQPPQTSFRRC
ncbi:hypothetical protein AVEN_38337-1 [Araneus ventricosus]|uniref:Uncharacterized protein n=1 Tax=Araneus ventricosus TaxID=182803 RepID=A0A4Y2X3C6_ARAVE|nr:hypothetical protein AVEN_38337-1 [Araneus ventricosus]